MDAKEWLDMISMHVKWKQRLEAYIKGTSDETFDVKMVAKDNACILGKWIYSHAKEYEGLALFEEVRLCHADLHLNASEIVTLADAKQTKDATALLNGAFSDISHQFKRDIVLLSKVVQK